MTDNVQNQTSMAQWLFQSLGFSYLILLPAAALLCFILALVVVIRGRGAMAAAALVLIVPIPILIGLFAAIHGGISSYMIIATSATVPKPAEVAAGISTALVAPLVAMLLSIPAYAVAVFGAFIRSLTSKAD